MTEPQPSGRDREVASYYFADPITAARLARAFASIRREAIEECARWHENQIQNTFGTEYGLASTEQRRTIRFYNDYHVHSATAIRALLPESK